MLNLSDKELDRLSREAAQEHDPGDVLGSRSWEKLEPRLDRDLGKSGPNPLRGVRRFPFYYVPAILLVAGVFYFVKQSHTSKQNEPSGSPPSVKVQSTPATETQPLSSTQNPEHSSNSTPPAPPSAAADPAIANPATVNPAAADHTAPAAANSAAANPAGANPATNSNAPSTAHSTTPTHTDKTTHYPGTNDADINGAGTSAKANDAGTSANPNTTNTTIAEAAATTNAATHTTANKPKTGATPGATTRETAASRNNIITTAGATNNNGTASSNNKPRELTLSSIRSPRPLTQRPSISDSALRAYTAKSNPSLIQPDKNKSLRIKRNLQFGLSFAPDFSSVNSLAGDKPGSSFGLTVDYQFANHWYLSTGLLLDRKNYAARQQDYHVPGDYYRLNNMHNVDFVKGSFNMLEIPLNLRYDFSVAGSTLFFASAGFSSYLLTNENCNYYFNMFGREDCRSFNYSNHNNYLFSSINLSLGVETGISNSLSMLIAPYVKIPSRNIGFGQMQMNSVGINFALKFAPVTSRKRK
ncbi:MAG TPA: porin family protein [Puia sp.]|jgi:hypothetical protein